MPRSARRFFERRAIGPGIGDSSIEDDRRVVDQASRCKGRERCTVGRQDRLGAGAIENAIAAEQGVA
jgi:hypothetical protein